MSRNTSSSAPAGVVRRSQLHGISGVAQLDEGDALHHATVVDVEARNDALRQHTWPPVTAPPVTAAASIASTRSMSPVYSARPTIAASTATLAQPSQIVDGGDAPGGDHRHRGLRGQLLVGREVRPLHPAVATDVGVDDAPHPGLRQLPDPRRRRHVGRLRPALHPQQPVARVDGDDQAVTRQRHGLAQQRGVLDGGGAQHHAAHTRVQRGSDRVQVPHAAAGLHGALGRAHDTVQDLGVRLPPVARAVEVDDVDAARTQHGPAHRHAHRVVGEHRLLRVVALVEAHAFAVADVDRRDDLHRLSDRPRQAAPEAAAGSTGAIDPRSRASRRKFSYSRSPISPDFSG